jgi:hypothetical protein
MPGTPVPPPPPRVHAAARSTALRQGKRQEGLELRGVCRREDLQGAVAACLLQH